MRHIKSIAIGVAAAVVAAVGTVAVAGTLDQTSSNDPVALESADTRTTTGDAEAGAPADDTTTDDAPAVDTPATEAPATGGSGDTATTPTAPATDAAVSPDEAGQLAADEVGGDAAVLRVRRDDDDGRPEYEVHLRTADGQGYEVHVDATDGRILEVDRDDLDDDRPVVEATIDRTEAESIALAEAGDGEVVEANLDEDDGRPEWDLDVRRADGTFVEITIDATDGTVLEVDIDD